MGAVYAFLVSVVVPLLARALISLGFAIVSYEALTLLADQLAEFIKTNYNAFPSHVLQILNLSGFGTATAIIIAAYALRVSFQATSKLEIFGGKK